MKKVLVTPRSFGKNDPTLFDQLKAGGFEVVRSHPFGGDDLQDDRRLRRRDTRR